MLATTRPVSPQSEEPDRISVSKAKIAAHESNPQRQDDPCHFEWNLREGRGDFTRKAGVKTFICVDAQ
jgi:hypothetical protein